MPSVKTFYALGLNYTQAPVDVRGPFAANWGEGRSAYRNLSLAPGSEIVLLSTCNRTEAYLYGVEDDVRAVQHALARHASCDWPEDKAFLYRDEEAIRHIFEVASGMQAGVLGDVHIYFQLKEAYAVAVEEEWVDTTMHRLLHTAFRTAKRVINETDLSRNKASVPRSAAAIVQSRFRRNAPRKDGAAAPSVLIVGAGDIGQETGEALRRLGIERLAFANRTEARARRAAEQYRADYIPWQDRHAAAARSDAVIVATLAPEPVLRREEFVLEARDTPLLLIDISVPRGVAEEIGTLPHVELLTIDHLGQADTRSPALPEPSLDKAREIVGEMLSEYVSWVFLHESLQPAIRAIADTFETIRAQEVDKHRQRFSEANQEQLDQLTRSIVQKLLAVPVVRLKSVDPERIDFSHGVRLLEHLFQRHDCDDEETPATPNRPCPEAQDAGALSPDATQADRLPGDIPGDIPRDMPREMERAADEAARTPSPDPETVPHAS